MKNLHQQVTEQILSNIDAAGEWKPCWIGASGMPRNAVTKRSYSGVNVLVLWAAAATRGYATSQWATYKQWAEAGAQVRKGECSTVGVFYKTVAREEDGDAYRLARSFNLFNASQVENWDGLPDPVPQLPASERLPWLDQMIADTGACVRTKGHQPCYVPALDEIWMPAFADFQDVEGFYATSFHELAHWTGGKPRLDRELSTKFKTNAYAMEELVAELAASFVMAELDMTSRLKTEAAAYVRHWRDAMQADNTAIFTAASAAAKAADFILNAHKQQQQEAA